MKYEETYLHCAATESAKARGTRKLEMRMVVGVGYEDSWKLDKTSETDSYEVLYVNTYVAVRLDKKIDKSNC